MHKKLNIRKGDTVMVITGNSKGSQGKVLIVDVDKNRAVVEGVNLVHKHTRPNKDNTKGGIVTKEGSINISNLKIIDGAGNVTRVGRRVDSKTNKSVRYSKKSGEVIK
jgi:large subunit ribosomal protein L24